MSHLGLENPEAAVLYTKVLSSLADGLAYTHLSSFAPLIPVVYYGVFGSLIYNNLAFVPTFLVAHHLHKLFKYFTNVQFEDTEKCNLAVANGELHILTKWNPIKDAGVYYTLNSQGEITEPIIKLLSCFDSKAAIHDPALLFYSVVIKTEVNELCNYQSEMVEKTNLNMITETEFNGICNSQSEIIGRTQLD